MEGHGCQGTFCPCIPTKTKSGNIYVLKGEYTLVWDTTVFWSMDALYCKYSFAGYIEFESDTIYKRWVDCFYAKKSQSAGVERELYKLFLNSLYGKTGQKEYQASTYFRDFNDVTKYITDGSKRKDISVLESIKVHNNSPITVSQNGVQTQALPDLNEGCYEVRMTNTDITPNHVGSLVFIASYITTGARLHLFKTIHYIKQRGGEVYYCDTDSIFTNIELPSDMVSETEIGLWKLEKKISKGKFWGSKCYMYYDESGKTTKKVKGVPKIFIPPDEELWNLDEGGISAHISTSWNRHWGYVENKESLKVIRSTLNRRIYSNNTSKPFKSVNEFLLF